MKILAMTPYYLPIAGGIEILVADISAALREKGIETVVVTDSVAGLPRLEVMNGIRVHRFGLSRAIRSGKTSEPLSVLNEMAKTFEDERPDVIHLHSVTQASAFFLDRLLHKMPRRLPLIATQHGVLEVVDQMSVTRKLLLQADILTGVSDAALNSAVAFSGRTERSIRIFNGIPIVEDGFADRTMPRQHGLVCVGRIQHEKGFDTAIKALSIVRGRGLGANLSLIGYGEDWAKFKALAAEIGLAEHVIFKGVLGRAVTRQFIARSSVLLAPSRTREGFSLVAAEAALAGTPCIASNVGGLPETVADGVSGYIVRPDDAAGLANAVVRLLQDEETWHRMSVAGRRRAQTMFDFKVCVESYASLYRMLAVEH